MGARGGQLDELQCLLESYYRTAIPARVINFFRAGTPGSRERLLIREAPDALELRLLVPPGDRAQISANDDFLQLVEGVSHFVYLVERARTGLQTTQLELELQAEVDKFVVLRNHHADTPPSLRRLHDQIYERVSYVDGAATEAGQRYRLANRLAARFVARHLHAEIQDQDRRFREFFRAGQAEKIHLAEAS